MARPRRRARLPALLAAALLCASCAKSPTKPPAAAAIERSVTVRLADPGNNPVAGVTVTAIALYQGANGLGTAILTTTDGDGEARFRLDSGGWAVSIDPVPDASAPLPGLVAGATFLVPGGTRPAADTVLVRLALVMPSSVHGTVTLAGRTVHDGTIVSAGECLFAPSTSDAAGHWSLDGLPPGRWTVTMFHPGFAEGIAQATVPAPGSSVSLPTVQLVSDPGSR